MEIGQCLRACKAARLSRVETLFRLATQVEGVYVPQFYQAPEGWVLPQGVCLCSLVADPVWSGVKVSVALASSGRRINPCLVYPAAQRTGKFSKALEGLTSCHQLHRTCRQASPSP